MIRGGVPAQVFRMQPRQYNRNGDPVDSHGNVVRATDDGFHVGDLKGVRMGGQSASQALQRRGESSDTSGQIGIPLANTIKVQYDDQLLIDGVRYKVTSRPNWTWPQSMSGTKPEFAWVSVEATIDG